MRVLYEDKGDYVQSTEIDGVNSDLSLCITVLELLYMGNVEIYVRNVLFTTAFTAYICSNLV